MECICKTKNQAMAALEIITKNLPQGKAQREALIAVQKWIQEIFPVDFTAETAERIQKIYDECNNEGETKYIKWQAHGGEPDHGTRIHVSYLFDSVSKTWQLEKELPPVWTEPHFLEQCDEGINDDDWETR